MSNPRRKLRSLGSGIGNHHIRIRCEGNRQSRQAAPRGSLRKMKRPSTDAVLIKLLGYRQILRGHVDSVARGINVPNAQPDGAGLASVNPVFAWVRLAQRGPIRIHIDDVPADVRLVVGLTATVEISPGPRKAP
jgi:multidrug resistance efflux pump